jgi:signal transduction histidine kinase
MNKSSVLIIDNDLKFADNTARLLREEGYEVKVAREEPAAGDIFSSFPIDLVLLNFQIPGGGGRKIVDSLLTRYPVPPKIILMNCDDEKVRAELLASKAIDFLSSPIENDVLLRAVKSASKSKPPVSGDDEAARFSSLEKFFPFLAHEIRNPLHAISGALTILQKRCDLKDEVVSHSVRIIKEEVEYLNGFVQECLDFVRPPVKSRLTAVDINEVAGVAVNVVSYIFAETAKKIDITRDFAPSIPKIQANYEELKRAFLNILKNGFEAIGQDGKIHIQTKYLPTPSPGAVEISFGDNGTGFKKENLKNLFIPFFTTKLRGTGLGLAICHRIIVERHGGKISIQSEEGKGATVTVQLPAGVGQQPSMERTT